MNTQKNASIFVAGLRTSPGPWHVKTVGSNSNPEFQLCDFHGKPIASILPPHPDTCTPQQFHHNLAALRQLPQLIAALVEAAYTVHTVTGHTASRELIQLITSVGGPDLTGLLDNESQTNEEN